MQTKNQEATEKPYRLGIASFRYNPDAIEQMLRYLEVPWESTGMRKLTDDELVTLHTVFALNPTFSQPEWDALFRHVHEGGTAMVLLSPDLTAHTECIPVLNRLGLRLGYTRAVKILKVKYSAAYPVSHKRAKGDRMLADQREKFATFQSVSAKDTHVPLIYAKGLLGSRCMVMQVNLGKGAVVFSDSQGLPEDRADLMQYLLELAGEHKPMPVVESAVSLSRSVAKAIASLFDVYEEIPLDVVARELAAAGIECDRLDLLSAIENCIRAGDIPARIRGETIVKAW